MIRLAVAENSTPEKDSNIYVAIDKNEKGMRDGEEFGIVLTSATKSGLEGPFLKRIKLFLYVILWYCLTVSYNITNKVLLKQLTLPISIAAIQIGIGIVVFLPAWIMKRPSFEPRKWCIRYHRVAWLHGLGNAASVYAFSSSENVSFVHTIKASEPLFAAIFSMYLSKDVSISRSDLYSLFLIVSGVALSSFTEATFNWWTLLSALASNVFYQLRIVLAKSEMLGNSVSGSVSSIQREDEEHRMHHTAATMFRIMTLISFLQLIPVALVVEGWKFAEAWNAAISEDVTSRYLLMNLLLSGIFYYSYNEVSFWVLDLLDAVGHSVANTLKRVVIILVSFLFLDVNMNNWLTVIGSVIAVIGTYTYTVFKKK